MNDKYYKHYDFYNMKSGDGLIILSKFKTFQQTKNNTCGPSCLKMVLNHFGQDEDEMKLAQILKTSSYPFGTNLVDFVEGIKTIWKGKVVSSLDNMALPTNFSQFKEFILKELKGGNPIIIENVDYGGHYKVIIGYDEINKNECEDVLIFADPSDDNDGLIDGYNYFPAERFFYMWFDDHCLHENEKQKPFIILKH